MANGRCQMHGGKSLGGPAAPAFKHGRYSRNLADSLPPRLREKFYEAMSDPELLSLRRLVGLSEILLQEAIERWKTSDVGDYRGRLCALCDKLEAANADKENPERAARVAGILTELIQLIRTGSASLDAAEEVNKRIRDLVAVTTQENRRLVEMGHMMDTEQAMAFIVTLNGIMQNRIQDKGLLSLIRRDFGEAFGLIDEPRLVECADGGEVIDSGGGAGKPMTK
jgi:hypothetical protein